MSAIGIYDRGIVNCGALWSEDCDANSSGNRSCRNALRSNLPGNNLGPLQRERRMEGGMGNQRKQSVIRIHLNFFKVKLSDGSRVGWLIINTTHNKTVHHLWQAGQSHTHTSTERRGTSLNQSTQQMVIVLSLFVPETEREKTYLIIYLE